MSRLESIRANLFYHNSMTFPKTFLFVCFLFTCMCNVSASEIKEGDMDKLVGQFADVSSSAYQYRADRKAEENSPESWLALMRYANQPLNKPFDACMRSHFETSFTLEFIPPAGP